MSERALPEWVNVLGNGVLIGYLPLPRVARGALHSVTTP